MLQLCFLIVALQVARDAKEQQAGSQLRQLCLPLFVPEARAGSICARCAVSSALSLARVGASFRSRLRRLGGTLSGEAPGAARGTNLQLVAHWISKSSELSAAGSLSSC